MGTEKVYDVSPEFRRLYEAKQKMRKEAKSYFARMMENPHRPMDAEMFDPQLFRYGALEAYRYEYFKPSGKNVFIGLSILVLPIVILTWDLNNFFWKRETLFRTGQVSYEDRKYKLLY